MTQMTEIQATAEQEEAAFAPHDGECKDWALEFIVEAAERAGVEMVGDINEEWEGLRNWERGLMWLDTEVVECHCYRRPEGFEGKRAYSEPGDE